MITVVTPAPDQLLTSMSMLKHILGLTGVESDVILEQLLRAASDWVRNYTGRTFGREEVTETFVGKGVPDALLSRTPIVSISEVSYKGIVLDDVVIDDADAGIIQREAGFTNSEYSYPTISLHPSSYGKKDWSVTYTGGYILPSWLQSGEERNLPYDLEQAVITIVKTSFRKLSIDESLKSYKIGDTTAVWATAKDAVEQAGVSMPRSSMDVLSYYRRAF